MRLLDIFKKSSPEQRDRKAFEKLREKTTVSDYHPNGEKKKSLWHELVIANPKAPSSDEDPAGTGEFGLTVTNPIPVYGIDMIPCYMDKLRYRFDSKISPGSHTFNPIEYVRNGSTTSPNINGNPEHKIDEYSIYKVGEGVGKVYSTEGGVRRIKTVKDTGDSNKSKLAVIYINGYSLKTSNKVPKGFFHRDEIDVFKDAKLLMEFASKGKFIH